MIKEIPEDLSMDEVKKIEEENSNIVISNLFREGAISIREFEDSEAVCLEIRGESLPARLSFGRRCHLSLHMCS